MQQKMRNGKNKVDISVFASKTGNVGRILKTFSQSTSQYSPILAL
jgi:hypothetical protein